jgi:hypothetical protein
MMPSKRTKTLGLAFVCGCELFGLAVALPSLGSPVLAVVVVVLLVGVGVLTYWLMWRYFTAKDRLVKSVLAGEVPPSRIRAPRTGLNYTYAILGVFLSQLALRHLPLGAVIWSAVVALSIGIGDAIFEIVNLDMFRHVREQLRQIAASQEST